MGLCLCAVLYCDLQHYAFVLCFTVTLSCYAFQCLATLWLCAMLYCALQYQQCLVNYSGVCRALLALKYRQCLVNYNDVCDECCVYCANVCSIACVCLCVCVCVHCANVCSIASKSVSRLTAPRKKLGRQAVTPLPTLV